MISLFSEYEQRAGLYVPYALIVIIALMLVKLMVRNRRPHLPLNELGYGLKVAHTEIRVATEMLLTHSEDHVATLAQRRKHVFERSRREKIRTKSPRTSHNIELAAIGQG